MILVILILGLGLYAFLFRAAAGGRTASDPSRLAPVRGMTAHTAPGNLDREVAAARLGSTLAAAAAVGLCGAAAHRALGGPGFAAALLLAVVVSYPLLEILPQVYAAPRLGWRGVIGGAVLLPALYLLEPLRAATVWLIERFIPGPGPNASMVMAVRREAMAALSDEGRDARTLRKAQRQLVAQVYEFRESTVEEVMVPRNRVVGLPAEATVGQAVALAEEHQFSRYPVYRGTLDQVEGVVHVFDLLSATDLSGPIGPWVRPITFAPAGKKCDELLSELQKKFQHAAIVVDEFGGTAGWVTVEDLLEELVGEIRDEHDVEEEMVRAVGRRTWLVDAQMRVDDLNHALNVEIPDGDYETLGGFLLETMERIPRRGERTEHQGVGFEVVQAEPRRIIRVRVTLPE